MKSQGKTAIWMYSRLADNFQAPEHRGYCLQYWTLYVIPAFYLQGEWLLKMKPCKKHCLNYKNIAKKLIQDIVVAFV